MSTRVVPTFLLKGVDPRKLLEDYRNGHFAQPRSTASKINVLTKLNLLAPSYSTNRSAPVYTMRDRHNTNIVIASSNHVRWSMTNAHDHQPPSGGTCGWCRTRITSGAIGYPIDFQELTYTGSDGATNIVYRFGVEDTFCDCECALAYIQNNILFTTSPLHMNARVYLNILYMIMYPKQGPLLAAQCPLLLIDNGGSLSYKEWKEHSHSYLKTDRVIMAPARVEYIQHLK